MLAVECVYHLAVGIGLEIIAITALTAKLAVVVDLAVHRQYQPTVG